MGSRSVVSRVFVVLVVFAISSAYGREPLRPPADVGNVVRDKTNIADRNGQPCLIDIHKDLPKTSVPQPLYIVPDTDQFWLPNDRGYLEIPRGATIELHCTSSFANASVAERLRRVLNNTQTLRPTCLHHQTFLVAGEKLEFRNFTCVKSVKYAVERTSATCAEETAWIYRVGFNVTHNRFLEIMQICYDANAVRTHYAKYRLLPANVHFQRFVRRQHFSEAGQFGALNIRFLYSRKNQRRQAEQLVGASHAQYFDNKTLFLTRGHLAAKSDMIYATQQRATFNYLNTAPQWQSFNGGHWATLEDNVRKYVAKERLQVDCYTGTLGTLELSRPDGARRRFYLAYDPNKNGLLPVPRLYYRIIVDRRLPNRGIVLVGVNDPLTTMEEIRQRYEICIDVQAQVPWLRWIRNNNRRKGYIYACRVSEFVEGLIQLPAELSYVDDVLGAE